MFKAFYSIEGSLALFPFKYEVPECLAGGVDECHVQVLATSGECRELRSDDTHDFGYGL